MAASVDAPLNKGLLIAYLTGTGLMLGALVFLLWRAGGWNQEALLYAGLMAAIGFVSGPELATVLRTGYCLKADGRGIRVGCWRREVRIPWGAVARFDCANPVFNRKGVHSLVIRLREASPGPTLADGVTPVRLPGFLKVRGTYIGMDCHELKRQLDALLAEHGVEDTQIPKL